MGGKWDGREGRGGYGEQKAGENRRGYKLEQIKYVNRTKQAEGVLRDDLQRRRKKNRPVSDLPNETCEGVCSVLLTASL